MTGTDVDRFRAAASNFADVMAGTIRAQLENGDATARPVIWLYELLRTSRTLSNTVDTIAEDLQNAGVTLPADWREANGRHRKVCT